RRTEHLSSCRRIFSRPPRSTATGSSFCTTAGCARRARWTSSANSLACLARRSTICISKWQGSRTMGSLRDVWRSRFTHYTEELQRYTKFIFTGHLAIVLVFLLGAGGYAYSGWLKTVSADFPAAPLAGIILAAILAYAPPATLLKGADAVFFLPMEEKLGGYMQSALKWTSVSGI